MGQMTGKDFEKLVQESCELQSVDCTRLKDSGWKGEQTQRRFTSKNICDFILFDQNCIVYAECKVAKERLELSRLTQHDELIKKYNMTKTGLYAGYLICIKDEFYFVGCAAIEGFKSESSKKSLNLDDVKRLGIKIDTYLPIRARKPRLKISGLIIDLSMISVNFIY